MNSLTIEERIVTHKQWVKEFGIDSLIKQYAEYQDFMSIRCKEYRKTILELKNEQDT